MSVEHKYHDLASLRRVLDVRLQLLERDLQKVAGDIPAQVQRRKALAQSLELGKRLVEIYEPVRDSPNWIKGGSTVVSDHLSNIVSKREGEEDILEFDHNRGSYSLRLKRLSSEHADQGHQHGGPAPAVLSFCDAGGIALFAVSVMEEPGTHGRSCKPGEIEAFIPGNWIKDFLELSEEIAALKREMEIRKKYDPAELERLKKHFGL